MLASHFNFVTRSIDFREKRACWGSRNNFGFCNGSSLQEGGKGESDDVRKSFEFSGGSMDTVASCEQHRMAGMAHTPLRGVDWTAPHPAINKLGEREQPRDEPFNSATFCLPSLSTFLSNPLSRSLFPPSSSPPRHRRCRLARCSSIVTLAISDSTRALPHFVPQQDSVLSRLADYYGLTKAKEARDFSEFFP